MKYANLFYNADGTMIKNFPYLYALRHRTKNFCNKCKECNKKTTRCKYFCDKCPWEKFTQSFPKSLKKDFINCNKSCNNYKMCTKIPNTSCQQHLNKIQSIKGCHNYCQYDSTINYNL